MKVFPPSAIANLLAANRDTTRVLFRLGRSLADWCSDHILDLSQPLQLRWSLLQFKSDGRTPTAMRGYISAVSSVHGQVMNKGVHGPASKHKAVSTRVKGLVHLQGASRSVAPPWNLEVVLHGLIKSPFEPLETTSLTYLMRQCSSLLLSQQKELPRSIHWTHDLLSPLLYM